MKFDVIMSPRSVCLSVPAAIGAQLPWAIGTLAACSLAVCGLRTRPRTDVDPPQVELPSAGGISSRRLRGDNLFAVCLLICTARILRGAGSMRLSDVRPSICLSVCLSQHGPTAANLQALFQSSDTSLQLHRYPKPHEGNIYWQTR